MVDTVTRTDLGDSRWGITDEVTRLREAGARRMHVLPKPPGTVTLGASASCTFRVEDPRVSREHLQFSYTDGCWIALDLNSKNGTRIDGIPSRMFSLMPGCEIRVGGMTLVAESPHWIDLRAFLERILGWGDDQVEIVDSALRQVRYAALGRSALYLTGTGDLVPCAHALHRRVWGPDRPFVVCDPRRSVTSESVRSSANKQTGLEAFASACGGTMCVRAERPPRDFQKILEQLGRFGPRVLLIVVGTEPNPRYRAGIANNPSIRIPPLALRAQELPAVIAEYAAAAADQLLLPLSLFTPEDRDWVLQHAATSLPEIEKATRRLIALRGTRNVSGRRNGCRWRPCR
jgi:hypothetical protein